MTDIYIYMIRLIIYNTICAKQNSELTVLIICILNIILQKRVIINFILIVHDALKRDLLHYNNIYIWYGSGILKMYAKKESIKGLYHLTVTIVLELQSSPFKPVISTYFRKNFLVVDMYLSQMQYQKVEQQPAFDSESLMSMYLTFFMILDKGFF